MGTVVERLVRWKGPEFEPSSDHWDFSEQTIQPTLLHSTKVLFGTLLGWCLSPARYLNVRCTEGGVK